MGEEVRLNKRERYLKHQNHLRYLHKSSSGYPSPVWYKDRTFIRHKGWIDNPKPYYKRMWRSKSSKYIKRLSHRKIRRYKGYLPKGNSGNKLFDFWWEYC